MTSDQTGAFMTAISTEEISYRKYVDVLDTYMAYVDAGNEAMARFVADVRAGHVA